MLIKALQCFGNPFCPFCSMVWGCFVAYLNFPAYVYLRGACQLVCETADSVGELTDHK